MSATDPITPAPRRFSIPRPLWLGLADGGGSLIWRSLSFRRLAYRFVAEIAFVCCYVSVWAVIPAAAEEPAPSRSLYHADPEHLWNRLHEALFVREGPDGRPYGQDRLEPLLWAKSKYLLEERSHERAMALLGEFLKNKGEQLIDDPLKRAVLQRDLWLVFNWLEGLHRDFAEPKLTVEAARAAHERLRGPLAAVIRRLALSPPEIRDLPDNYAAAVASGQFAKSFDLEKPDQTFLPIELFSADGPWVCVGRADGRTAPQHLREENPFTNSVFLVFVRLPAGRVAVADYLKHRPPFPPGTELALVRRAMLIDTSHRIVPSSLTESVQIRTIRGGEVPSEFRLSRSQLFAGRGGGLRSSGNNDRDFKTGFLAHMWDEFEYRPSGRVFPDSSLQPMKRCSVCHTARFPEFQSGQGGMKGQDRPPYPLSEMPISEVADAAIKWREAQPNWKTLRKLLVE